MLRLFLGHSNISAIHDQASFGHAASRAGAATVHGAHGRVRRQETDLENFTTFKPAPLARSPWRPGSTRSSHGAMP